MKSTIKSLPLAALVLPLSLSAQPANGDNPLDKLCGGYEIRNRAACELASMLETDFIYPEQGARYAKMLRERIASHAYRGLGTADAARKMTADLLAVAPDGHLRVEVAPPQEPQAGAQAPAGEDKPTLSDSGWLIPSLAYMRLDGFSDRASDVQDIQAFLSSHADAEALVIDLRANGGGQFTSLDALMPYFFAEPRRLVAMANRHHVEEVTGGGFFPPVASLRRAAGEGDLVVREHWSLPRAPSKVQHAVIYVLTSNRTGSAAEHLAFALKITERAILVGKPTGGANHFGGLMPIAGGLQAFIPLGRTYDPQTGEDWESKGVTPHVDIEPAEALDFVLHQFGVEAGVARTIAAKHTPAARDMERWHPDS